MAVITSQVSGSPLIGSPIVYQIVAGSYGDTVFHRVKLQVVAGMQGGDYTTIEMSSPAEEGETLNFDISSALRAVADQYIYTPEPPEYYPYIQYYLVAWDEYMVNGITYESSKDYYPDNYQETSLRGLMGAYSDLERLIAGESKQTLKFTRKPSSPEVLFVGDTFVRPTEMESHSLNITHGPQSLVYLITNPGLQTVGGATIYAHTPKTKDHYNIRFINGLGCMESVSVMSLKQVNTSIITNQYTHSIIESFGTISRGLAVKKNDIETWNLSSGPLDEEWQSWYIHEFLMSEIAWINIKQTGNPLWVRCHILPEENTSGINRISNDNLAVNFSIQLDITGSPLYHLAI